MKVNNTMKKTVYVLGAGFSKPANAPIQSEIMEEIFKLPQSFNDHNSEEKDFQRIIDNLNHFRQFLLNDLYIDQADFRKIPLEDIFTPIDRCIIDGISFRSLGVKELVELREKIYELIITAIAWKIKSNSIPKPYIDKFADYLIAQMRPRMKNKDHDPVSIISTNWDILLDTSIKRAIENDNNDGVVDYCCYISSLEGDETIKPGLWALGRNKYNVKILKLHGSTNWLNCPKCQRLYVAFHKDMAEYAIHKDIPCKHCNINFREDENSAVLRSNLIMPTFLKDLTNFQIKLIWQNAGVELSEADKVVFIGYSLPQADYELRQLLSRMIRHKAKIEIVLKNEKDTKTKKTDKNIVNQNKEVLERYKTFFGKRKIKLIRIGAENYLNSTVKCNG